MDWLQALAQLRAESEPAVMATVTEVVGHAPREPGAKMVVSAQNTWGSIGGGNLEATAINRSRALLSTGSVSPETMTFPLNEHAPNEHGRQCCGGVATVLLEPLRPRPAVAIFGVGHVGLELARILSRMPIRLVLVDSRTGQLAAEHLTEVRSGVADVEVYNSAIPDSEVEHLPKGSHVLIMTHDHAEDFLLCDAALRKGDFGSVGLIGSRAKWSRFRHKLRGEGHADSEIAHIQCPIGLPDITGKSPIEIAVSTAAALLQKLNQNLPQTRPANTGPEDNTKETRDTDAETAPAHT